MLCVSHCRKKTRYGFTLIELVTVMVMLGILGAITVAGYTAVTNKSRDTIVKQALVAAAAAQDAHYRTYGSYAQAEKMGSIENSYSYVAATNASTGPTNISVWNNGSSEIFALAAKGPSGTCYAIKRARPGYSADPTFTEGTNTLEPTTCTGLTAASSGKITWGVNKW